MFFSTWDGADGASMLLRYLFIPIGLALVGSAACDLGSPTSTLAPNSDRDARSGSPDGLIVDTVDGGAIGPDAQPRDVGADAGLVDVGPPPPALDIEPEPFVLTSSVAAFLVRVDRVELLDGTTRSDVVRALEGRGFHLYFDSGSGLYPHSAFHGISGRWLDRNGVLVEPATVVGTGAPDGPLIGAPLMTYGIYTESNYGLILENADWSVSVADGRLAVEAPFVGTIDGTWFEQRSYTLEAESHPARFHVTVLPDRLGPILRIPGEGLQLPWFGTFVWSSELIVDWSDLESGDSRLLVSDGRRVRELPSRGRSLNPPRRDNCGRARPVGVPDMLCGPLVLRYSPPGSGWLTGTLRHRGGVADVMGNRAAPVELEVWTPEVQRHSGLDLGADVSRALALENSRIVSDPSCRACLTLEADARKFELYTEFEPQSAPSHVRLRYRALLSACPETSRVDFTTWWGSLPVEPGGFHDVLWHSADVAPSSRGIPDAACGTEWNELDLELPDGAPTGLSFAASIGVSPRPQTQADLDAASVAHTAKAWLQIEALDVEASE